MITAKQARDGSYNEVVLWCEKKLQAEIEFAMFEKQNVASKLFTEDEVNPEELAAFLKDLEYKVEIVNMTKQCGFKSTYGAIYNVTIRW